MELHDNNHLKSGSAHIGWDTTVGAVYRTGLYSGKCLVHGTLSSETGARATLERG